MCGQAIIDHPEVRKIGFTGSTPVGKQIMASCANSNLKKCSLELGGKSPLIIFADCDLGKAVRMVSMIVLVCRVGFICCGYRCVANRSRFEIFKIGISGFGPFYGCPQSFTYFRPAVRVAGRPKNITRGRRAQDPPCPRAHVRSKKKKNPEFDLAVSVKISLGRRRRIHF